jgi:hypothetical protein
VALAAALWVLSVSDILLTRSILSLGGVEGNPLMTAVAVNDTGLFLKIVLVGAVCAIAAYVAKTRWVTMVLAVIVGLYLATVLNNTFVFWYLT